MILTEKKISTLQVCNPTDVTRTYLLSAVNKTMDQVGRMIDIPDTTLFTNSLNTGVHAYALCFFHRLVKPELQRKSHRRIAERLF